MPWSMIASVGLNALSGVLGANAARQQERLNNAARLLQAEQAYNRDLRAVGTALDETLAYNKAAVEANITNSVRANVRSALLLMQRANAASQYAQGRHLTQRQGEQLLSATTANAAASGTVGASVAAVATDAERTLNEALQRSDEDWAIQAQNFITAAQDQAWALEDSLYSGRSTKNIQDPQRQFVVLENNVPSNGLVIGGAILGGLTEYATAKMKLGLSGGSKSAPIQNLNFSGG